MKPTYQGFKAQERKAFTELPPAGCYVAEIKGVRVDKSYDKTHDTIVCLVDIIEGEYKNRYLEVYNEQKEKFQDVKSKGVFTLVVPNEGDEPWRIRQFENNMWCIQESNPGFEWKWEEQDLKGKKIGINVRNHLYIYKDQERSSTEIARFERVADVKAGKCKAAPDRDTRKKEGSSYGESAGEPDELVMTDVSGSVEVPF